MDQLLQKQGPQPTSGHAEEAVVHVHALLQREARTDFVRKSESVDARGCQNLLRAVSGKFNIFLKTYYSFS